MNSGIKKILSGLAILVISVGGIIGGLFIWKNNYDHIQFILFLTIFSVILLMSVFILLYGIKDIRNTMYTVYTRDSDIENDIDNGIN